MPPRRTALPPRPSGTCAAPAAGKRRREGERRAPAANTARAPCSPARPGVAALLRIQGARPVLPRLYCTACTAPPVLHPLYRPPPTSSAASLVAVSQDPSPHAAHAAWCEASAPPSSRSASSGTAASTRSRPLVLPPPPPPPPQACTSTRAGSTPSAAPTSSRQARIASAPPAVSRGGPAYRRMEERRCVPAWAGRQAGRQAGDIPASTSRGPLLACLRHHHEHGGGGVAHAAGGGGGAVGGQQRHICAAAVLAQAGIQACRHGSGQSIGKESRTEGEDSRCAGIAQAGRGFPPPPCAAPHLGRQSPAVRTRRRLPHPRGHAASGAGAGAW